MGAPDAPGIPHMLGYYVYLLDARDHIVGRRLIEIDREDEAIEAARELLASGADAWPAVELWQGSRKVRRIERTVG
jgi:hypothetical protein